MKKQLFLILVTCCFLLSACGETVSENSTPVPVASSYEKGTFGEQLEKRPIRMINVKGELYYDSGLVSDLTPRCGTMDYMLKQTAKEGEIPKNPGEANFPCDGCQFATDITYEIPIDGQWHIFKKFTNQFGEEKSLTDLQYCFYIKGHLNNAAIDSELAVLTSDKEITFSQIFEPLLSSKFQPESGYTPVFFDFIFSGDKWGVSLSATELSNTGVTLQIEQFGGNPTGELQTGEWFSLEQSVNEEWQPLDTNPLIDYAWHSVAYVIPKNDITELKVDWKWLYGELEPGFYRLSKEIMDFRDPGDFDKEIYYFTFTIE